MTVNFSEKDVELRGYLLPPDKRATLERMYAGDISIQEVWRHSAVLTYGDEKCLFEFERGSCLNTKTPPHIKKEGVWPLLWHKAAEVILAVRKAHDSASTRKRARKIERA